MSRKSVFGAAALSVAVLLAGAANATVATYTNQTDWAAAAGGTITNTTEDARPDSTAVTTIPLDDGSLLTTDLFVSVAHAGSIATGWETWAHGYTGAVYASGDFLNIGLSAFDAFGLEIEPANEQNGPYDITLTLDDGTVMQSQVEGKGGAQFFGWIGSGISSMSITSGSGSFGFGFGNFFSVRDASVPEPVTLALFGAGLAGMASVRRRKPAA